MAAGRQVTDVQRVDPSGPGSVAGHLLRPLAHAGAFTLGGTVFVAGGRRRRGNRHPDAP